MHKSASILMLLCAAWGIPAPALANVARNAWGETPGHQKIDLYTLTNHDGLTARISTYGGALVSLQVPDRTGKIVDIVRGFDSLDGYLDPAHSHIGAIIGRYANSIRGAQFTLEGTTYRLNNTSTAGGAANTQHGGPIGFDKRAWHGAAHDGPSPSLTLTYTSLDGEMNFPGTLKVTVVYTLSGHDLRIDYRAVTDKPTVLNLTNHSYFNLKGAGNGDVLEHRLQVDADADSTADGRIRPVAGTPFDFRTPTAIGLHIDDPQLAGQRGYNQNFIIRGKPGTLRHAARVEESTTGRVLDVFTTQPSMELYSANNNPAPLAGKHGELYIQHGAFCLETQHYPNAPNVPSFPSTELKPGQHFHETTVFRFSAEK